MEKKEKKLKKPAVPEQKPQSFPRWFLGKLFALVGSNARTVVVTTGVCVCVWFVADAFKAYAGKKSEANMMFGFFADIRVVYTVSVTLAISGIALYLRERKLHRQTRERLAGRITELELQIDPDRRSSKLTSQGLTREDDK